MDNKLIQSPKNIITKFIFNADIEKVWELLMDHEYLLKSLLGDIVISFEFTKENKFDKIGSEFTIHCKTYTLLFKCIDLMVEPHYKMIKFKACSENKEYFFNHEFTKTLISNTMDGTTIFIWDMEFENSENQLMTSSDLEAYKQSRLVCLKRWSDHLTQNQSEYTQYESIKIDASRESIWDIITNWSVLRTISPCIADEVEYDGDHHKEGSSLKLTYNSKRKVVCYFKIVKVKNELNSHDWEYAMEMDRSYPKIPYQQIKFSIVFLASDKCFLTFTHTYKERLNKKMLDDISAEKKSVLADIKKYSEINDIN